jgi:hypothetical protein
MLCRPPKSEFRESGGIRNVGAPRIVLCFIAISALASHAAAQFPGDLVAWSGPIVVRAGPFVACATGYEFYMGIQADGSLQSWSSVPPHYVPAGSFVAASGSLEPGGWALLLRDDGSIGYWGMVNYVAVSQGIPEGPFIAVAAGANHNALALRQDGTIAQWGVESAGTPPSGAFTAIAAGYDYGIALRIDGTLAAWGTNFSAGIQSPPVGQFIAISAGPSFAAAIRADGSLVAWGSAGGGALNVPTDTFVAVSVGDQVGMALRADGTAAAWGSGFGPAAPIPRTYMAIATGEQYAIGIASCYPNCDRSTTSPALNVADFTCFLQRFAAGQPYANCDATTAPPVLTVADFTCFLQKFALGCGGR